MLYTKRTPPHIEGALLWVGRRLGCGIVPLAWLAGKAANITNRLALVHRGEAMMPSFEVGDRVRARTSSSVRAGMFGRVYLKLVSIADMYFVQFDVEVRPTLMHATDLELVTDAPADACTA